MIRKKRVDPIPEEFASYEEAAEFWETHDTMDYPDVFRTVEEVETEFRGRYFEIEIAEDVAVALHARAEQLGIPVGELASQLLRQQLSTAA